MVDIVRHGIGVGRVVLVFEFLRIYLLPDIGNDDDLLVLNNSVGNAESICAVFDEPGCLLDMG